MSSTTLVGRAREVAFIRRAIKAAADGKPTVLLCVGEAGQGKSTLFEAALDGVEAVVVAARGDEGEVDLDYGIAEQLIRSAPLQDDVLAQAERALRGDPVEMGTALLRAVDASELRTPLVVVVDDAHLADARSLQALSFAARRLRADPVTLLLASRPEGVDKIPAGLMRMAARTGGRLDLSGLDQRAVAALAAERLGRSLPASAVERLRAHTRGNPLHTTALLDELGYDALVTPGRLPAPRSYSSLFLSRVASSSDPAQRLLMAMSVLGMRSPLAQVTAIADVEDALATVDELCTAGLADVVDGPTGRALVFAHELARTAVYDDLPPSRRAALHDAAARVTTGDEALRHRLAAAAGPDAALAAEAEAAAARAAASGAFRAAASHLLGAADVTAAASERERLILTAANQLLTIDQPLGALAAEIDGFSDTALRSLVLGRQTMAMGRFAEARALLERAWLQTEGETGSAVAGSIAALLALVAINFLEADEVALWARRSLAIGQTNELPAMALAHGLAIGGRVADAVAEMTRLLQSDPSSPLAADARLGRGIVRVWANDLDGARADLESVAGLGEQTSFLAYVNARAYLAEVARREGRLTEAADLAETVSSVVNDADVLWLAPLASGAAASALAVQGHTDRARTHAEAAAVVADVTGLVPARIWSEQAWLRIAAASADHQQVAAVGDRMMALGWERLPESIHHWRATYAESLVACGRLDDAETVTRGLEAEASVVDDASVQTDAYRARAQLEAGRGAPDAARAAEDAGLSLDPVAARPFERARLELAAGARRRRAGDRRAAARILEAAFGRLDTIGAAPWVARCERELRACGLRPAKRSDPTASFALTPQEGIVARLVARGCTNREVADELVISVKTVEHHLGHIYDKLGVRSRTQVAALLREAETPS